MSTYRSNMSLHDRLELVPEFDGDILNFETFWSSYTNLIQRNSDLADIEKYNILRKKLGRKTANEHLLPLAGLDLAFVEKDLRAKFTSKGAIVERVKQYLERVKAVSSEKNYAELSRLLVHFRRCYAPMANFAENERTFCFRLMLNKLPGIVKERYFRAHPRVAPLKTLIEFVDLFCTGLAAARDLTVATSRRERPEVGAERASRPHDSHPTEIHNPTFVEYSLYTRALINLFRARDTRAPDLVQSAMGNYLMLTESDIFTVEVCDLLREEFESFVNSINTSNSSDSAVCSTNSTISTTNSSNSAVCSTNSIISTTNSSDSAVCSTNSSISTTNSSNSAVCSMNNTISTTNSTTSTTNSAVCGTNSTISTTNSSSTPNNPPLAGDLPLLYFQPASMNGETHAIIDHNNDINNYEVFDAARSTTTTSTPTTTSSSITATSGTSSTTANTISSNSSNTASGTRATGSGNQRRIRARRLRR